MRHFNVTGICVEDEHYMVDISGKIKKIMALIDRGQYFTINRARQYGKTTTLFHLARALPEGYTCIRLSFEGVGDTMFENPALFCQRFLLHVSKKLEHTDADFASLWLDDSVTDFDLLRFHLDKLCKGRKIVLMIDEVDRTSNNRVFLHFIGMLRNMYLERKDEMTHTFQSVILAGVYDIKNIKLKLISEGVYEQQGDSGRIYNSPWNIAVSLNVDMSFVPAEISTMLIDYEADHHTGMDVGLMSDEIYKYTSGYPFLVSRICQCIDEELGKDWTKTGVQDAVKTVIDDDSVLFDDIAKNLESYKEVYDFLYSLLIIGEPKRFIIKNPTVQWCSMFGYIKMGTNAAASGIPKSAVVANKIFEMFLTHYFSAKDENTSRLNGHAGRGLYMEVVRDGVFDMELCLQRFTELYLELFSEKDLPFLERHGRLLFLAYLDPLVNGLGFYHIESEFTDQRRMDIVVDFGPDQFIIEMKLWRGESGHQDAYDQLLGYMRSKNASDGYLLTFDFRKGANKHPRAEWVDFGGMRIFDVVV